MDIIHLLKGIVVGFSVSVPLGPIGILCVQRTMNYGRRSGFASGIGAALSDMTYAVITGFSITFIIEFLQNNQLAFQIAGAVLLLLLGIKIYLTQPKLNTGSKGRPNASLIGDMVSTYFLTITNPLTLIVFIGVFAGFGMASDVVSLRSTILIILGIFLGAALWWFALTCIVNLFRSKINENTLRWINKIAGATIVIFVIVSAVSLIIYNM